MTRFGYIRNLAGYLEKYVEFSSQKVILYKLITTKYEAREPPKIVCDVTCRPHTFGFKCVFVLICLRKLNGSTFCAALRRESTGRPHRFCLSRVTAKLFVTGYNVVIWTARRVHFLPSLFPVK